MNNYARIDNGKVAEVVALPAGLGPADFFVPEMAGTFVPCPKEVKDQWTYTDGVFSHPSERPAIDLAAVKASLKMVVDVAAETERLKYITPGAGQAMTYQQKMEEVRALAQDADPDPIAYPLLSAEIGITASTLMDVAAVVLAAYRQWQQIGAAIEAVRLGTKSAIDAAVTVEAAVAAAHVVWPNS